jgi:hypothetical protein
MGGTEFLQFYVWRSFWGFINNFNDLSNLDLSWERRCVSGFYTCLRLIQRVFYYNIWQLTELPRVINGPYATFIVHSLHLNFFMQFLSVYSFCNTLFGSFLRRNASPIARNFQAFFQTFCYQTLILETNFLKLNVLIIDGNAPTNDRRMC